MEWFKKSLRRTNGDKGSLATRLQAERMKSNIIVSALESGVIVIDEHRLIQLINPAAARLVGWPEDEAIGIDYDSVLHFTDEKGTPYPDTINPFSKSLSSGQSARDNTAVLLSRDNASIPVNISVSPIFDPGTKKLNGIVGIFSDVTEQRREERQRGEFISTASHEMRTPVAAIEGYLALAMNDKVASIDTKAREYLQKAHSSTEHLGKLFQDLLTSAKAEDGRLSNHPTVVEMGGYLQQLTEDLKFSAEKKGLQVEFVMGSSNSVNARTDSNSKMVNPLYYVYVDADRMREVISNLFDNAVKYSESGKVSIGVTANEQVVQFYIKDTGPGIPPGDIPHLFQKFYRVDNSATRTIGGTGLGLFICRKIVEMYNGRIWVESEVGRGTAFLINLPRVPLQRASELQKAESAAQKIPELTSPTAFP